MYSTCSTIVSNTVNHLDCQALDATSSFGIYSVASWNTAVRKHVSNQSHQTEADISAMGASVRRGLPNEYGRRKQYCSTVKLRFYL